MQTIWEGFGWDGISPEPEGCMSGSNGTSPGPTHPRGFEEQPEVVRGRRSLGYLKGKASAGRGGQLGS